MTWLYIVGPIVALLLLLLLGNVVLKISYKDGDFKVKLRFLVYGRTLYPAPEKKPSKKKKEKPAEQKPTEQKKKPEMLLSEITQIIGELKRILGDILKKTRVKPCKLYLTVATGDAAQTAIAYGGCCAALGALEAIMTNTFGKFKSDFSVACDYSSGSWKAEADITVKLRPVWVIGAALAALGRYVKNPGGGLHLVNFTPKAPSNDKTR